MLALERAMAKGDARSQRLEARKSGMPAGMGDDAYENMLLMAARGGSVDAGKQYLELRKFKGEAPLREAERNWREQQGVLAGAQAEEARANIARLTQSLDEEPPGEGQRDGIPGGGAPGMD